MTHGVRSIGFFWLFYGLFSLSASAQVAASASASASIIVPIGITKEIDLDFGNISAGLSAGTVVLTPDGSRIQNGGPTFSSVPGNVAPATFNITGTPDYTYAIILPSTPTTLASGSNLMTVDSFSSDPVGTGTLGSNGSQDIHVGARLHVGAAQPVGVYQSLSQFTVMVNYN